LRGYRRAAQANLPARGPPGQDVGPAALAPALAAPAPRRLLDFESEVNGERAVGRGTQVQQGLTDELPQQVIQQGEVGGPRLHRTMVDRREPVYGIRPQHP